MIDYTINRIWQLRGELDNAILTKNYKNISIVKQKYLNFIKSDICSGFSYTCYKDKMFVNSERAEHIARNMNSILNNIESYENKYLYNKNVDTKIKWSKSPYFLAGEIWVIRAMYDDFVLNAINCETSGDVHKNIILGKSILDRLVELKTMEGFKQYFEEGIDKIYNNVKQSFFDYYKATGLINNYGELLQKYSNFDEGKTTS